MGLWQRIKNTCGGGATEPPSAEAQRTPEELFRALFIAEAFAHPSVTRVEPAPGTQLSVHVYARGKTEPDVAYLDSILAETREFDTETKRAQIRNWLASLLDTTPDWEEAQSLLVPVVRVSSFGVGLSELAKRPFVPGLSLPTFTSPASA